MVPEETKSILLKRAQQQEHVASLDVKKQRKNRKEGRAKTPTPRSDVLPPAQLCLLSSPQPPQAVSANGDGVFKHASLR